MESSYNAIWFNEPIEVRRISYTNSSGLWVADHYYSRKHGLIYTVEEGDSQFELTGALVGGTIYGIITGVTDRRGAIAESFDVANPYPNPFNSSVTVEYTLSHEGAVSIRIYGILGDLVKKFGGQKQSPGKHVLRWGLVDDSGKKLPSGVYFLWVDDGKNAVVKKIIALE